MMNDIIGDEKTLTFDSIDYQQYKEESYETVKFTLDTDEHTCEICYQNLIG